MIIISSCSSLKRSLTLEIELFLIFEYLINHPTIILRCGTLISSTRNGSTMGLLSGKEGLKFK